MKNDFSTACIFSVLAAVGNMKVQTLSEIPTTKKVIVKTNRFGSNGSVSVDGYLQSYLGNDDNHVKLCYAVIVE